MYKIYLKKDPDFKIVNYNDVTGQKLLEEIINIYELKESGKLIDAIQASEEVKKDIEDGKYKKSNLGIVQRDYSLMTMFHIVNEENLNDSFNYIPYMLIPCPLKEENLKGLITLKEFVAQAEKISKKVKLTNKKRNEVWFEGDCLYKLGDLLLTKDDNIINLEITDKSTYEVEFGDDIEDDYNYETIYEQLCSNIKSDGLDIKGSYRV